MNYVAKILVVACCPVDYSGWGTWWIRIVWRTYIMYASKCAGIHNYFLRNCSGAERLFIRQNQIARTISKENFLCNCKPLFFKLKSIKIKIIIYPGNCNNRKKFPEICTNNSKVYSYNARSTKKVSHLRKRNSIKGSGSTIARIREFTTVRHWTTIGVKWRPLVYVVRMADCSLLEDKTPRLSKQRNRMFVIEKIGWEKIHQEIERIKHQGERKQAAPARRVSQNKMGVVTKWRLGALWIHGEWWSGEEVGNSR